MSDLAATNCQNSCGGGYGIGNGNSIIWILLLLCCCGGSTFGRNDDGCGCDSIIWILLLLSCCGGNSGGFSLGCGC